MPPLACDCHLHVFGTSERYPFTPRRSYTPPEATIEDYRASHRPLGLARVVLVQASAYGSDNRCMLAALARLGDAGRAVAVVDAAASAAELAALDGAGVRGMRVNIVTHGQVSSAQARDAILRMAERIAPLGWHLQLFLDPPLIAALAETLATLPLAVVIDHMGLPDATAGLGQPGFAALLDLVRGGSTWVKLSGADRVAHSNHDFRAAAPFARALIAARPDRLVWGSDWPHIGWHGSTSVEHGEILPYRAVDDGKLLGLLAAWGADEATRQRILVDNPAQLYGF
ncbi:MAG: amidohydrolase family protein [Alphaproteobacteria bacterium]